MNILFIIPGIKGGGQEKAARMICNYLHKFHRVTVVCFEKDRQTGHGFEPELLYIKTVIKKTGAGKLLALRKRTVALRKIKKQIKPDISIAFGNSACILNYLTYTSEKKIAGVRQSLLKPAMPLGSVIKWHDKLHLLALKKASYTVAVCQKLVDQLQQYGIFKTGYVYNCIEEKEKQFLTQEVLSQAATAFFKGQTIVHTGRFDPSKCHWQLVDIFCMVKRQLPAAKLLLIGAVGHSDINSKAIYDYCFNKLNGEHLKICFLVPSLTMEKAAVADIMIALECSNPYPLLKLSDLFVFPSSWEGFPNAMLEAMSTGLPVISADCATGPSEMLLSENKKYGVLLPAFTTRLGENNRAGLELQQIWSNAIVNLLTDPVALQQFRDLSLQRSGYFSAEKILPGWTGILKKITS